MKQTVTIANAQGFWGDRSGEAARLLVQMPSLDYITMDYLAEVSLSILALQKEKDASLGYAQDFIGEVKQLISLWKNGASCKLVVNAGGLNPLGLAREVVKLLQQEGCPKKVGIVSGDDVLCLVKEGKGFLNLDTGESIQRVQNKLVSANAYLGGKQIAEALLQGAEIVITGRVADPSLVVGCAAAHFGWKWNAYDQLAGATVAGHLIECGTQVTGGISTNWLEIEKPEKMGFPVVEIEEDGTFVITKPEGTGGIVNQETVKEQLLYEIGDPGHYLSPDVSVSFLSLELGEEGKNRIFVRGAKGTAPPSTLKVSASYKGGYMAEGMLALFGRNVKEKALKAGGMVLARVEASGFSLEKTSIECIGSGDLVAQVVSCHPIECILRVAVQDARKEAVECFAKEMAPLVTSGPQGTTGYFRGRPKVRQVFEYWPCLIEESFVQPSLLILDPLMPLKYSD